MYLAASLLIACIGSSFLIGTIEAGVVDKSKLKLDSVFD